MKRTKTFDKYLINL